MRSSADRRSRRQKLEAMARQTASPNEAEIARRKLAEMDAESIEAVARANGGRVPLRMAHRTTLEEILDVLSQYENPYWTSVAVGVVGRSGSTHEKAFRVWWDDLDAAPSGSEEHAEEYRDREEWRSRMEVAGDGADS